MNVSDIPPEVARLLLVRYRDSLRRDVFSPENVYYAGLALRHEPTPEELKAHFDAHGGQTARFKRFMQELRCSVDVC